MVGSKIGAYILEELIGEGSTGIVYRAHNEHLVSVHVAVKFLAPAYCQDREMYTRFVREAQVLEALHNCRNIINIQHVGDYQGQPYLVMEYQPETLAKRLKRGPLAPEEAIRVAEAVLRAFEAFHTKAIIHRDVKPDNIFLRSEDSSVALGDFSIALATHGERLTGVGLTPGTPEYMSPEQVQEGQTDARTDIYALGIVMCEMLSGQLPFKAATRNDYYYHQMHTSPTLPTGINSKLSAVLKCALQKDPANRFQSAADMRVALEQAAADMRVEIERKKRLDSTKTIIDTPLPPFTSSEREGKREEFPGSYSRKRNVGLAIGAIVLGLACISAVVKQVHSSPGREHEAPTLQAQPPPDIAKTTAKDQRETEAVQQTSGNAQTLKQTSVPSAPPKNTRSHIPDQHNHGPIHHRHEPVIHSPRVPHIKTDQDNKAAQRKKIDQEIMDGKK